MNLNRFNLIIECMLNKDITQKEAENLINKFVVDEVKQDDIRQR